MLASTRIKYLYSMRDTTNTLISLISRERQWPLSTPLPLPGDEIHVHYTMLDAPPGRIAAFRELLTDDEQARADRFRFTRDHNHYVIAHSWLRTILAAYLEMHPRAIQFSYSQYGKPHVENQPVGLDLRFNLSHAGKIALLGVARGATIGVDVEQIRMDFPVLDVAEHFFSDHERAVLAAVPPALQHETFFNAWTRKEAYIKAIGEGLSHPLADFDVSLAPGDPPQILATRPDPSEAARWSLASFAPYPGYIAAVAIQGRSWRIEYFPPAS